MEKKPTNCKTTQLDRIEKMVRHTDHLLPIVLTRAEDLLDRLNKVEIRLANLNAFETLQEALSEHKEPETLKVGDWVVRIGSQGSGSTPNGTMGTITMHPQSDAPFVKWATGNERPVDRSFLRCATRFEIDAHLKVEEERKPLKFGTPVRWRDRDGLYLWKEPNDFHRIAVKGDELFSAGTTSSKRSEFTVVNPS